MFLWELWGEKMNCNKVIQIEGSLTCRKMADPASKCGPLPLCLSKCVSRPESDAWSFADPVCWVGLYALENVALWM